MTTIQPVRRYNRPKYPDSDYLLEHPELLRLVPKRWRKNKLVLSVLSAAAFLMAAGESTAESWDGDNGFGAYKVAHKILPHKELALFAGGGAPIPTFTPEEVARRVIIEEARKAGIEFVADSLVAKNIMVLIDGKPQFLTIRLDGYDPKHNVAYEFVSSSPFERDLSFIPYVGSIFTEDALDPEIVKQVKSRVWIKAEPGKDRSESTVEALQRSFDCSKNVPKTAFFWLEPVWGMDTYMGNFPTESAIPIHDTNSVISNRVNQMEPLRAQVRDFIQYLKAQGVI